MRTHWISLAFLAGCTAFEPTLLDFEATLPGLIEVGGLVATGDGFEVAGLVPEASGAPEVDHAVLRIDDAATAASTRQLAARPHSQEQLSTLLVLPGGDRLLLGHNGSEVRGVRLRGDEEVADGPVGTGSLARAAAVGVDGTLAVVGSRSAGARSSLWAAVLRASDLSLVGEATWEAPEGAGAAGLAVAPAADGGFWVAGHRDGERPVLLRLTPEGALEPTNRHPAPATAGRASALVALTDGRLVLAGEAAMQGEVGLFDPEAPADWQPQRFCTGDLTLPTRPVAMVLDGAGALRLAGHRGYGANSRLWLYATDLEGLPGRLVDLGELTEPGTARIYLAFSAAGGLALATTLCRSEAAACTPVPTLWHMDAQGSAFGEALDPECL